VEAESQVHVGDVEVDSLVFWVCSGDRFVIPSRKPNRKSAKFVIHKLFIAI
jgi:hypothetical protein